MAYVALYRKWRPDSFKNLVGQEHISRTLSNAITSGRIGHAYLFSGPRGTGKTSTAKILAKSLNCDKGPTLEPCGVCESCRKIADGSSMDVYEIDAASNRGIDEIRDLRETVQYAPVLGRYKVYIIDEVHMLTTEAFNALLKTLEEPPAHVVFILATTEAHKVPATIQSRCQRYDFKRITLEDILGRLQLVADDMKLQAEPEALRMIALRAEGGMRDALSIMDQCTALSEGNLTKERVQQLLGLIGREWVSKLAGFICKQDSSAVLSMVAELLRDGKDLNQLLSELSAHFRSIMLYQATNSMEAAGVFQEGEEAVIQQSKALSKNQIMGIIRRLHEAMSEVKWSPQPRISVEAVLLELCQGNFSSGRDNTASFDIEPAKENTSAVSDGRIAQLELKIGQLTAMVEELKANPPVAVNNEPMAPAVPVAMPKRSSKPSDEDVAKLLDSAMEEPVYSEEMQRAWENVKAEMGGPLKAMLVVTKFIGIENNNFHLAIASAMFYDRIQLNPTKGDIERRLRKHTGMDLHLRCHLDKGLANDAGMQAWMGNTSPKKPAEIPLPPEPKQDKATVEAHHDVDVNMKELQPKEHSSLQNAVNVFGDHFVEMDGDSKKPEPVPMVPVSDEFIPDTINQDDIIDDIPIDVDFADYSDVPPPEYEDQ
ncbi:MAG: DNA polymerase III subunit gamma/tau [Selenomonadaceae bacterium]|nr:DNA polymerase III subunit gamma/tau [Selenomonadaceae bacterium]